MLHVNRKWRVSFSLYLHCGCLDLCLQGLFLPSDDAKDVCRGLNEVGPQRIMGFNTWFLLWEGLGSVVLGKICVPGAGFVGFKAQGILSDSLSANHLWTK